MVTFCPKHLKWDQNLQFTPLRERRRASPSLLRGVTTAPLGFQGYSRSNANYMRKNRNPASSSTFSRCTRIPVLGLGHMTVCLENSELNFSLRLLQAFTSGARMLISYPDLTLFYADLLGRGRSGYKITRIFGLAQPPCWILKMLPP